MKKILILSLICICFLSTCLMKADRCLTSDSTCSEYVFVSKFGSKGMGDGQFGGTNFSERPGFSITDETIEKLKKKLDDEKLESLKDVKYRIYDSREQFCDMLKKLNFDENESQIVEEYAVTYVSGCPGKEGPLYIALDKSGNIYVTDVFNYRIQKFDPNGNFIIKWGSYGYDDGQFTWPQGITVDGEGNVYVADRNNQCIQKFGNNGEFISKWGGNPFESIFRGLTGITIGPNGYLYVAATDAFIFDTSGVLVKRWVPFIIQAQEIQIPNCDEEKGYIPFTTSVSAL